MKDYHSFTGKKCPHQAGFTEVDFFVFCFLKKDSFIIICKYTVVVFRHTKRVADLITDSCEPPFSCWVLNMGPTEEQSMLLTTEPSL